MLHPLQLKEVSQRFPGEIAEVQDFLYKSGVPVETPGAIASVAAKLRQEPTFCRDLGLHLWAISNAPGRQVSSPDAMAMLAVAAAGPAFAAQGSEADTRELLRFVMEARGSFDTAPQVDRQPSARIPAALAAAPPLLSMRGAAEHREPLADSDDDPLLSFATEDDSNRRRLLWSAAAVAALLLLCFGLWLHSRPSSTNNAAATAPPAPITLPAAQPPVEPTPVAPRPAHRTPAASAAPKPAAATSVAASPTAPNSRTRVPALPAAAAPRNPTAPRNTAPSRSIASAAPANPTPARTQPKTPPNLAGVPPKADVYLGTAAPPAAKASRNKTKAARSDTPVYRSSSSDAPIVELYTPVVRPTTLGNMASHLTYGPAPQYPAEAVDQHVQGQVTLEAEVDTTGNVISTRVVSGPPLLQEAAMNAVHSWQYRPYLYDGKPIAVNATVVMDFQLR